MAAMPAMTASAADLPSAEDVIGKYLDAIGGKDKATGFKTRIMKGTFNLVDMGMEASITMYMAPPNYLSVVELPGMGTALQGVTDGKAWQSIEAMGQIGFVEGEEAAGMLQQAEMELYANWDKHYASAESVGEETVGDVECIKVEMTPKEGSASTVFFDKESGLIVQTTAMAQGMEAITTIADYKEIDGVKIPHSMSMGGMMTVEITIDSVENNAEIADDQFDVPEAVQATAGN
jgi:hypothetical protein